MAIGLTRRTLAIVGGAGVALIGAGLFWLKGRPKTSVSPPASAAPSASASAVPSAAASARPARPLRELVYDCSGLGAKLAACSSSPATGGALIEAARWVSGAAISCSMVPRAADWQKRVNAALGAVSVPELSKRSPLERVLVQNAALRIAICSKDSSPPEEGRRIKARARKLVQELAPTPAELGALSGTSKAQLLPWLGDGESWKIRTGPTRIHATAEGFTLLHERLGRGDDFMNAARLIGVDKDGRPRVLDVVGRLSVLRYGTSKVAVCLADTRPTNAGCGAPGVLHPMAPELGAQLIRGSGGPPCWGCHAHERGTAPDAGPDLERELAKLKADLEAP